MFDAFKRKNKKQETIQKNDAEKKNAPQIKCFVDCYKGYGREYWGAEPNKLYYVLKILSVEKI